MTHEEILTLLEILELPGGAVRSQNVQLACPFAATGVGHKHAVDRHPSLGLFPFEDGAVWHCFSCGRKGGIHAFLDGLEKELGFDVGKARERLAQMLEKSLEEVAASIPSYNEFFKPNPRRQYPVFPDAWLDPYKGRVPKYILDRGLPLPLLQSFEVGSDTAASRVLFPVRDYKGGLVGAVGGLTRKVENVPKYKNYWHRIHKGCGFPLDHRDGFYGCPSCRKERLPLAEVGEGFRKSNFLYGEWKLGPYRRLSIPVTPVVVEGIVDCLKAHCALNSHAGDEVLWPLAMFGSLPSFEQAEKLVRFSTSGRVIALFDNDTAGREGDRELVKLLARRLRYFRAVYPKDLKEGQSDPGELPAGVLREMLDSPVGIFTKPR